MWGKTTSKISVLYLSADMPVQEGTCQLFDVMTPAKLLDYQYELKSLADDSHAVNGTETSTKANNVRRISLHAIVFKPKMSKEWHIPFLALLVVLVALSFSVSCSTIRHCFCSVSRQWNDRSFQYTGACVQPWSARTPSTIVAQRKTVWVGLERLEASETAR
jgi:hypothetical protein